LIFLAFPHNAYGASQGITITPPFKTIEILPDQSRFQFTAILHNQSQEGVNLSITVEDFGSLDDSSGLFFLGAEPHQKWDSHRLAKWITVSPKQLHLNPGDKKEIVAEIINDHNLTPGGHYAALVASIETNRKNADIAINQALSSLLFVNKIGGEEYRLNVQTVEAETEWWGRVEGVEVEVQNSGNTHVVPRGSVELVDPLGNQIAHGVINNQSSIVLPDSSRQLSADLSETGLPLWPGKYTLVLAYRYDGQEEIVKTQQEYISIGLVSIGIIVLGFFAGLGWTIKRFVFRPKISN